MRAEMSTQLRAAQRRGEIDDMTKPESQDRRATASSRRASTRWWPSSAPTWSRTSSTTDLQHNGGDHDQRLHRTEDMTVYFMTVPANKLELWFWMEADRLREPVFREFYSERDVVYEERRLRVESTPTGKFEEAFDAMFWDASPYALAGDRLAERPARPSPRRRPTSTTRTYYAPQNLTAMLVGDFDPQRGAGAGRALLRRDPGGHPAGAGDASRARSRGAGREALLRRGRDQPGGDRSAGTRVPSCTRTSPALEALAEAAQRPDRPPAAEPGAGRGIATERGRTAGSAQVRRHVRDRRRVQGRPHARRSSSARSTPSSRSSSGSRSPTEELQQVEEPLPRRDLPPAGRRHDAALPLRAGRGHGHLARRRAHRPRVRGGHRRGRAARGAEVLHEARTARWRSGRASRQARARGPGAGRPAGRGEGHGEAVAHAHRERHRAGQAAADASSASTRWAGRRRPR